MKILSSEQMRNIDRRAIEQFGIPSIVLMENAAAAVARAIAARYPEAERIAIFCGAGNNGGDGFAVARHLESAGVTPLIIVLGERSKYTGDAAANLRVCERLSLPIHDATDADSLDQSLAAASQTDLLVDAIFGTGLNRPPEGLYADAIRGISSLRLPIVAVDLPSGMNGSSAEPFDPVVRADLTVTFAQPKIPHIFAPAAALCGELVVADISIPAAALEAEAVTLSVISPEEVARVVPPRDPATHKGTYGHVGIVAGSTGRSGAAILSARGALRGGAGLVTVVTDPDTARIVDSVSVESMTLPLSLLHEDPATVAGQLRKFSALVIGPGLPDEEESYARIRELLQKVEQPAVVDATAINAWQGAAAGINRAGRARILTPHPGELARLMAADTAAINRDRITAATEAAKVTRCVMILKGHQTVVAEPGGHVGVNPTGNPGMASGGMGDVLSGLAAALLAAGYDPFDAARAAVYLHGLAGDILRDRSSDTGLAAMDLADSIPLAIARVRSGGSR